MSAKIEIDFERAVVCSGDATHPFNSPEAFRVVSDAWLRIGWDTKYVYGFSWMGRPIIQLPEDMVRVQEAIYAIKPDVIIETGVAHGGSLVFYASLCKSMGKGRVVGIDIEIRPHNRKAIEEHELFSYITLIEGSSVAPEIVDQVKAEVKPGETVLILLDSNHTKAHVAAELQAYAPLVSLNSYIIATDGIMAKVVGGERTSDDWTWNNPEQAALEFVAENKNFVIQPLDFPFNEGKIREHVTYWPNSWIKRIA